MPIQAPDRRTALLAATMLAFVGPLGAGGCRDAVAPFPLPTSAERFAPPPVFARWWPLVEGCSGRTGDFAVWAWYQVPAGALRAAGLGNAEAYTDVAAHRVVLTAGVEKIGSAVRHEMLHALLGPAYASGGPARVHPPAYFQGRCAGVVYCPDVGCADAGPAPVTAPPDVPTLPLAALTLGVDVIPASVSRAGADHALTIVIRATNPNVRPAWVPLDATPGVPAPRVAWRGFRIVPAAQPLPVTDLTRVDSTGIVAIDTARRVPFAAGETQRVVFDMSGAQYPPGDYLVVGIFNTRQVAVPLTVTP